MNKKRRYQRVTFSALTELLLSEEDTLIHAYPFSAGYGGMGVYTLRPISIGQEITARIFLNMGNGKKVMDTITSVVKWCDLMGGMYRLGIEFKEINPKEHRPLLAYLKGSEGLQ
jgi:c-di-GMP-binding flagellar brake protein YcgR